MVHRLAGLPAFARRLPLPEDSGYGRIVVDGGPVEGAPAWGCGSVDATQGNLTGAFPGRLTQ